MNQLKNSMLSFLYRKILIQAHRKVSNIGWAHCLWDSKYWGHEILGRHIHYIHYAFRNCIKRILFHANFLGPWQEIQIERCKSSNLSKSVDYFREILKIDGCNLGLSQKLRGAIKSPCNYTTFVPLTATMLLMQCTLLLHLNV